MLGEHDADARSLRDSANVPGQVPHAVVLVVAAEDVDVFGVDGERVETQVVIVPKHAGRFFAEIAADQPVTPGVLARGCVFTGLRHNARPAVGVPLVGHAVERLDEGARHQRRRKAATDHELAASPRHHPLSAYYGTLHSLPAATRHRKVTARPWRHSGKKNWAQRRKERKGECFAAFARRRRGGRGPGAWAATSPRIGRETPRTPGAGRRRPRPLGGRRDVGIEAARSSVSGRWARRRWRAGRSGS